MIYEKFAIIVLLTEKGLFNQVTFYKKFGFYF